LGVEQLNYKDWIGNTCNSQVSLDLLASLGLVLIWFQDLIVAFIASAVGYWLIHRSLIRPLKGSTGDIYHTVVEVTEAAFLIGLAAVF
jgi:cobalamin synthase